ncbi:MAG: acylneuraminate cytidylyltransferase family protein [Pseudomonadota bacterium]
MSVVAVVCARSGSKGIPDKNIYPLLGKPLLAYSVETANSCSAFDAVLVTSDSKRYLDIAASYPKVVPVLRPSELAADTVTKLGAIEHAVSDWERVNSVKVSTVVDLDVTSPLRTPDDVNGALDLFFARNPGSVITGAQSHRSPYTNMVELTDTGSAKIVCQSDQELGRRQLAPPCFDMNASVYVWNRKLFKESPRVFYSDTLLYEMPPERSWDIDSPLDIEIVEFLMRRQQQLRPNGES